MMQQMTQLNQQLQGTAKKSEFDQMQDQMFLIARNQMTLQQRMDQLALPQPWGTTHGHNQPVIQFRPPSFVRPPVQTQPWFSLYSNPRQPHMAQTDDPRPRHATQEGNEDDFIVEFDDEMRPQMLDLCFSFSVCNFLLDCIFVGSNFFFCR